MLVWETVGLISACVQNTYPRPPQYVFRIEVQNSDFRDFYQRLRTLFAVLGTLILQRRKSDKVDTFLKIPDLEFQKTSQFCQEWSKIFHLSQKSGRPKCGPLSPAIHFKWLKEA